MEPTKLFLNSMKLVWQLVGFLMVLALFTAMGLAYSSQVLADLTHRTYVPARSPQVELVFQPMATDNIPGDVHQVISQRLNELHLAGSYNVSTQNEQLVVSLESVGRDSIPYVASILSSVGNIAFIDGGTAPPIGRQVHADYPTLFTGAEIKTVALPDPASGQIFYQLSLESVAVERLIATVAQQPGTYICMAIDARVINCSRMYHYAGTTLEILPGLSSGQDISMADLAIFLKSGPLPTPLQVITY